MYSLALLILLREIDSTPVSTRVSAKCASFWDTRRYNHCQNVLFLCIIWVCWWNCGTISVSKESLTSPTLNTNTETFVFILRTYVLVRYKSLTNISHIWSILLTINLLKSYAFSVLLSNSWVVTNTFELFVCSNPQNI